MWKEMKIEVVICGHYFVYFYELQEKSRLDNHSKRLYILVSPVGIEPTT